MKKKDTVTGKVIRVDFPDKGIVSIDNEDANAVVKGVLPGQTVKIMITKKKNEKVEGRLLEVISEADNEIKSDCPHFDVCGGCTYRKLPYEDQLKLKASQVERVLAPVLSTQKEEYQFDGIKASPVTTGYKNKMEFSFGDEYKDGPLTLGLHKRGSFYDIEPVRGCRIIDEDQRKILSATIGYFKDKSLPFYHKLRHEGYLRHLLLRKGAHTGQILVGIVTTSSVDHDMSGYAKMLLDLDIEGEFAGILHIINDSLSDVVKADSIKILHGTDHITDSVLGLNFKISPFSFFQTNTYGAEVLYDTVREYAGKMGKDPVIYDLYSGTGTIAQILSPVAKKVIGVEIVEEAVEAAKENAAQNGLHNCEFIAGDVLKVLDDITEKPDFIVLDPPRDGVNPKALSRIVSYNVDYMIYISCKVTSLARDLPILLSAGYRVERYCCIDQFPAASHVETVVLLGNKFSKAKDYVEIGIDAEDYYRIKDSEKESK